MLKIFNLDRQNTLPGGMGYGHDRAIVVDTDQSEPNVLTGEPQPLTVYRGTLSGAHTYVDKHSCSECNGSGRLETLGGDWGKTPEGEAACWMCKGTGVRS